MKHYQFRVEEITKRGKRVYRTKTLTPQRAKELRSVGFNVYLTKKSRAKFERDLKKL